MKRHADLTATLRLLFEQCYPLLGGALVAALTVLAGMALLGLSGWFITATAIAGWQTSTALMFDVFGPSAGIRLLALGRTGARYSERLITHDATFAALVKIRVRLFQGWALPDAANRMLRQPSKLLFRLTADIDALEAVYLRLLVPACTALCAALAAGVTLSFLHSGLGLTVALLLLTSGYGVNWWLARCAQHPNLVRARSLEKLRSSVIDLVAGHTDLVMAGRMAAQRAQLAHTDRQLAQADRRLNRLETGAAAVHTIISSITLAAVLVACAALVEAHAVTVPLAVLALLVSLAASEPFAGLRRGALEAGRALLAMKRLGAHLDAAPAAPLPTAPADGGLRMSAVSVAPAGHQVAVLHAVTLNLAAGEKVALIGPSGAGKSTLLALAAGELTPCSGTLEAPRASLFTQRTELFQDSLRDNLRLADPGADDMRLWAALAAAGLADEVRGLASGLDTELGEGGLGLSGGQARRLALARLFLQQAPLWLLDEATEALNATIARDVLQRLAMRTRGHTVLIATHLRREAELADRLIIIRQGGIVGDVRRGTAAFDAAMATLRVD